MPIFTLIFTVSAAMAVSAERITVSVDKGDTLYSIGREYRVSVQELIEVNGILNPRQLRSGTEIVVPFTHEVEKGDTLYGISRSYNVAVDELCEHNEIRKDDPIKVGQVIRIPHRSVDVRVAADNPAKDEADGESTEARQADRTAGRNGADQNDDQNGDVEKGSEESAGQVAEQKADATKSEDRSNSIQEVRYEKRAADAEVLWPHTGKRIKLTGKLKGTQIEGEVGDRIVAVSSGKVVWVAPYRGYGELVMVENSDGHIYAYGGNEETFVEVGDRVDAGTVIGRLGINPMERNAKVFFFVYRDGKPVDPEKAPRG